MSLGSLRVMAADYDVTATVPFSPPTQPAVFDPSLQGKTVNTESTSVFGTCEHLTPTSIVSIWRAGNLIGSVNCEVSGTFQVSIQLLVGSNTLIARTSSLSNNYGPDSTPITITYVLPSSPTPSPTPSASPSPAPPASPSAPASGSDLSITTPEPFVLLNEDNQAAIQVIVKGGKGPYTISINWGDGTTESSVVADIGTFAFKHDYESQGIYKVVATVMDVLGASEVYQFIVSATALSGLPGIGPNETGATENNLRLYMYILGSVFLLFLTLVVATSFWLGRRYEYHELKNRIITVPKQKFIARTRRKDGPS